MAAISYHINRVGAEWNDRAILRLLPGNVKYSVRICVDQGSVWFHMAAKPQKRFIFFNPRRAALREAEGFLNAFLSGQKAYGAGPSYGRESIDDLLGDWDRKEVRTIYATHEPRLSDRYNHPQTQQDRFIASPDMPFLDQFITGLLQERDCVGFFEICFRRMKNPPRTLRLKVRNLKERAHDPIQRQQENQHLIEELNDFEAVGAFVAEIRVVLAGKKASDLSRASAHIRGLMADFGLQPKQKSGIQAPKKLNLSGKRLNTILQFPKRVYRGVEVREESPRGPPTQPTNSTLAIPFGYPRSGGVTYSTPQFVSLVDLKRHLSCWGLTGSGKTRLIIHMVRELVKLGIKVIIFDPKGEYADSLISKNENWLYFKVGDLDFPIGLNPFQVPSYAEVSDHTQLVKSAIFSAIGADVLSPQMEAILSKGIEYTIARDGSFATLLEVLSDPKAEEILGIRGFKVDLSCLALKNRLETIISGTSGRVWNVTASNVTMDMLLDNNVIIDLSAYEAAEDVSGRRIFLDIISHLLYNYLLDRRSPISEISDELRNVILADEVQKLVPRKLTKRFTDESSLFAKLPQTVRAFGVAMMWAGVAPTVEDSVLSQTGTNVIFYSKAHHDLKIMASLVGMPEGEFRQLTTALQDREAIVKTPNADAYVIFTMNTPIKKLTPADWEHQKVKWAQESARKLYEQTRFNLTPQFQDMDGKNEKWNPRKHCDLYCLNASNCIGISDVTMARTAKILKEKTVREWLFESLQSVEFPPSTASNCPPKIERVWKQLERENRKDNKNSISLPVRTFCSSIHFLREAKDISSDKLEYIQNEFVKLARISYIDKLSSLVQKRQTNEKNKPTYKKQRRMNSKKGRAEQSQNKGNENAPDNNPPLAILSKFVRGNIEEFGFFAQQDANKFFLDRKLGRLSDFSSMLKQTVLAAGKELDCRITKVAVPSFTGTKLLHIFAKEMDPNRKNSFERGIHRYFIVEVSRMLEDMGHKLKRTHRLSDGHLDDICVESGHTGYIGRIEIKTGKCVNLRKQNFPQTNEAYLLIVPWRTKISKRRIKTAAVPLARLDHIQQTIKQLGPNYSVVACDDPDFSLKLNAWANTGLLERAAKDPAH
ncbi:MAG: ATP-binding protein [Candidatus Heimdallarchaeota archaeon]